MLSGNLELFALADVLRFVARSGATGAVNVYRPAEGGRILLAEGEVVGASVDGFEAADADGVIEAGLRLLDGGAGEFALDIEPVEGVTRQSVEEFLTTIGRRRAEWRKIVAAVGSLDEPLRLTAHIPQGVTEITLSPLEWRIAVTADAHRSLREISTEVGATAFTAATALLAMANAGLLALPGGTLPDEGEDEPEAAERPQDVSFDYDEPVEVSEEAEDELPEPVSGDDDLDPAELLRELGEQPAPPRARRLTPATREEQRLRLRSR